MDKLIQIYIDMLAQTNHNLALLMAENEELKMEIEKMKIDENKEIDNKEKAIKVKRG
ncbi:hypothetical protein [Anaerococcus vaginalis]|uniref:hypothetical protein n=1 Tax=Anaerococcus vaginalis TaxID=33037 RepID=UPI00291630F9|nr:hypothetical protein [Anaerococcus vaginalis]